ncbi:MAG: FIVAR domain-containing protein, partial [Oscillospiraceae bacterium]|nr:FIVAR domain-containing protein [Oscillospiraceae bacterium]
YYAAVPDIQVMDGFTAKIWIDSEADAVTRHYSLLDGNGKSYILSSSAESARETANTVLDFILAYCKTAPDYAVAKSRIEKLHSDAKDDIAAASAAAAINTLKLAAVAAMTRLVYADVDSGGAAYKTIIASAQTFAQGAEAYIAHPARLTVPSDYTAAEVLTALLNVEDPEGNVSSGVGGSGWLFTVNNTVETSAADAVTPLDGDVIRWQYAGGADLTGQANKDALTRKVAELCSLGTTNAYGTAYETALTVLKTLTSTVEEINAALLSLDPSGVIDVIADVGGGTVTPANAETPDGNYTVTANADLVIDEIWVDGARLTDVQGKKSYTTTTTPARGIFATFAYTITYDAAPTNGTLAVYRGETLIPPGGTVRGGEVLTVRATPNEGYMRDAVGITSTGLLRDGLSYSFTVTADVPPTVAATFKPREDVQDEAVDYGDTLAAVLGRIETDVTDPRYDVTSGDWAVVALARAGAAEQEWIDKYLANVRDYIKNPPSMQIVTVDANGKVILDSKKYTENSRAIIGLTSVGQNAAAFPTGEGSATYDLVSALTDTGMTVYQGLNGPIFALIALDTNNYLPERADLRAQYLKYILDREKTSGGWDLLGLTTGMANADVTGMALQALAPYFKLTEAEYNAKFAGTQAPAWAALRAAATKAVSAMSTQLHEEGGFAYANEGITSESAAQVLVGLCSLNYDGTSDGAFIREVARHMLQFYNGDGSFRHQMTGQGGVTQMSTEQAAYALVAYDRYVKGEKTLYDMTGADKTLLNALLTKAGTLKDALTTAGKTAAAEALETALTAPGVVSTDYTATQTAIDAAKDEVVEALGTIVPEADAETLLLLVSAVEELKTALTETDYTAASWKALNDALSAAKAAVAEAVTELAAQALGALSETAETAETAEADSQSPAEADSQLPAEEDSQPPAEEEADSSEQAEPAEPSALETAGDVAEADGQLPENAEASETPEPETTGEDSDTAPTEAPDGAGITAESEISGELTAQSTEPTKLDLAREATLTLLGAIKTLARAETEPPVEEPAVDKTALNANIEDAKAKNSTEYTKASWTVLLSALDAAVKVAEDEEATQDDVNAANTALYNAISKLEKLTSGPSGPGTGEPGETDELAGYRQAAYASLDRQYNKYRQSDYTAENWQTLLAAYNKGKSDIASATRGARYPEDNIIAALNTALDAMRAVPYNPGGTVTVAISIDAGALGLGYIIKPTLVTVQRNSLLSHALTNLITESGYEYKNTGSVDDSSFYFAGIAPVDQKNIKIPDFIVSALTASGRTILYADSNDPQQLLEEFDYANTSGWMYTVSDGGAPIFPGVGAGAWQLGEGEVVRWQFTVYGYGADLDADNSAWGAPSIGSGSGDKTALTWRVAELRSQYSDETLEKNADYNAAITVLTNLTATQAELNAALTKL